MSFLDNLYEGIIVSDLLELEPDNEERLEEIYSRLIMDLPEECKFIFENYGAVTLEVATPDGDGIVVSLFGTDNSFLCDLVDMQENYSIEKTGNVIIIGDDMGDSLFLYGEANEGLGLYLADAGAFHKDDYIKLADSISDFFCKGIGIEKL